MDKNEIIVELSKVIVDLESEIKTLELKLRINDGIVEGYRMRLQDQLELKQEVKCQRDRIQTSKRDNRVQRDRLRRRIEELGGSWNDIR